jgi:hypothetical protein
MPDAKGVLAAQLEALPFRHSFRPLVRQVLVRTTPGSAGEAVEVFRYRSPSQRLQTWAAKAQEREFAMESESRRLAR